MLQAYTCLSVSLSVTIYCDYTVRFAKKNCLKKQIRLPDCYRVVTIRIPYDTPFLKRG